MKYLYPNKGKDRLLSMIEGRPDWCVSRQKSLGVPLPIFINKKTKEPLRDQKIMIELLLFMKSKALIVGLLMIQNFLVMIMNLKIMKN